MRDWHLTDQDPLSLVLVPDGHMSELDPQRNDIWELSLGGAPGSFLGMHTTYGLKAINMLVKIGFSGLDGLLFDPGQYFQRPAMLNFSASYCRISCEPVENLTAEVEFWVVGPHLVSGRVTVFNFAKEVRSIKSLVGAALIPLEPGQPFTITQKGLHASLVGGSSGIYPVIVQSGGPSPLVSPLPALATLLRLNPGESKAITWACASENDPLTSQERAFSALTRDWEKELARLEITHDATIIDIQTGNEDWDAALAFSQQVGRSLVCSPAEKPAWLFPYLSSDITYTQPGAGQPALLSPLMLNQLSKILLPANPGLAQLLVSQAVDEHFTFLSSRKTFQYQPPFLADLCWQVFQHTLDKEFAGSVLPKLDNLLQAWFSQATDLDRDGLAELTSFDQLGLLSPQLVEDDFTLLLNEVIKKIESPALAFLLLEELDALCSLAAEAGIPYPNDPFQVQKEKLEHHLKAMFKPKKHVFSYQDRDTHTSNPGKFLFHLEHLADHALDIPLEPMARLVARLRSHDETHPKVQLVIKGLDANKEPVSEKLIFTRVYNPTNTSIRVTENVFSKVTGITAPDLSSISLEISTPDLSLLDISCLLPMSTTCTSRAHIHQAMKSILQDPAPRFQYGIPEYPFALAGIPSVRLDLVNPAWNFRLIENLADDSFLPEALELFSRLMNLVVKNLKASHAFYEYYSGSDGAAGGHKNALSGLLPVSLYLQLAGIRIISPTSVELFRGSAFPAKLTVRYRGMHITREGEFSQVRLPNGKLTRVYGIGPHLISQL